MENELFPTLERAYSYVYQEESRRNAILQPATTNKSTMMVKPSLDRTPTSYGSINKNQLKCEYYGKSRHTKETYWFLHGRPTKGKDKRQEGRHQGHLLEAIQINCGL